MARPLPTLFTRRSLPRILARVVLGTALLVSSPTRAATIAFPRDAAVLDLRRDLGAAGDGVADDTEPLQKGVDQSCGVAGATKVLFIPNGVYRITRTIVVRPATGPWIYGETRDGAVIRLSDGAARADTNITAVLRTHPSDTQAGSADFFMRSVQNLTIDAGKNPSADGVRWFGNNSSLLKNVRVTGAGRIGVNAGFIGQNGPNLIQDALIEGFETGVSSQWMWGETLSRVTIRRCRKLGVQVEANAAAIEDLVVEDTPTALNISRYAPFDGWNGVVALVGGRFTGGAATQAAITNRGVLYARDVATAGFRQALDSDTPGGPAAGPVISEYLSHDAVKLFADSPSRSFRLPVRREPDFPWETNPARWFCANDFGARPGDNQDDTAALQKAVDAAAEAGASTVYLRGVGGGDPNWYSLDGELRVHGSVRHILSLGFGRMVAGPAGRIVVGDAAAPIVKFQQMQAFGGRPVTLVHRSERSAVVCESCDFHIVGEGRGDIFLTDAPSSIELRSAGQSLWARQLNPEGDSDSGLVQNDGGNLWALGVKHEGRGVRFRNGNGGRTEVFGMFVYGPGIDGNDSRPLFENDNSPLCAMGVREISFGATYPVKVREVRAGAVRNVQGGNWIGWPLYSGWTPRQTNGPTEVAMPTLQPPAAGFLGTVAVRASSRTAGSELHFTTDGTDPTRQSPRVSGPITVAETAEVRVKGFAANLAPSATVAGRFTRLILQPAEPARPVTNGLSYDYYQATLDRLPDFSTLTPLARGRSSGFQITPRPREDHVAFQFQGYLKIPADGVYTFSLRSDDGSRLAIGATWVVDNDGLHDMQERSGAVALQSGLHAIRVDYFNATGGSGLAVFYEGPGIPKQPVPADALCAAP